MGNLMEAAAKGNATLVRKFLDEGGDIQQTDMVSEARYTPYRYQSQRRVPLLFIKQVQLDILRQLPCYYLKERIQTLGIRLTQVPCDLISDRTARHRCIKQAAEDIQM
jgi:hypothetical protein